MTMKCEICSHTDMMDKPVCMNCFWKAKSESYHSLMGHGRFDVLDYELQNIKEELKQMRVLLNTFLPKAKAIKSVVKDLV